ncbi:hypothetical protein [Komagataeibacter europaeus]|uniref:hypothetical protein n=1 Tax=Komagataeibacter europaeus TaxID=33995 RepID=UPI00037A6CB8|nr:hypothetical protein [Komagataeibacter europaeus]GBQ44988.1 hypothetical protein AA18890_2334 [Komagataeibacter europaeus LMG 18890]
MSDWNGLPDQPERSGWHIIREKGSPYSVYFHYWWGKYGLWSELRCRNMQNAGKPYKKPEWLAEHNNYIGPVCNSSELAQMRKDERERAAQVCERWAQACGAIYDLNPTDYSAGEADAWKEAAWAIRALTDDEGKKS